MRGGPHGDERCLSVAAQRPPRSAQRGRSNAAALGLLEVLTTRAIASLGTMNDPPDTLDDLREMLAVVVSHIEDWRAKGPERTIAAPARNAGARVVIVDRFERGGRWFIVGVEQRGDAALTKRESQVVDAAIGGAATNTSRMSSGSATPRFAFSSPAPRASSGSGPGPSSWRGGAGNPSSLNVPRMHDFHSRSGRFAFVAHDHHVVRTKPTPRRGMAADVLVVSPVMPM